MMRGTTPTFIFTLPFSCASITLCNIAFAQEGNIILEKELCDCQIDGNKLSVSLTEEETLLFDCTKRVAEIQLRVGCGSQRYASRPFLVEVGRILKDGCLEDGGTYGN